MATVGRDKSPTVTVDRAIETWLSAGDSNLGKFLGCFRGWMLLVASSGTECTVGKADFVPEGIAWSSK